MFSMAMWMAVVVAPAQILMGDMQRPRTRSSTSRPSSPRWKATGTAERRAPEMLFGMPDMKDGVTRYKIELPWPAR